MHTSYAHSPLSEKLRIELADYQSWLTDRVEEAKTPVLDDMKKHSRRMPVGDSSPVASPDSRPTTSVSRLGKGKKWNQHPA